jgi:glutathione peroxidase
MKIRYLLLALALTSLTAGSVSAADTRVGCSPLVNVDVRRLNGKEDVNLCRAYQGKVMLIVNTASKCAFTSQYEGLEELYAKYKEQGLVVLGFPSNDFGNQEPGSEAQIQSFCRMTYGVQFPMFAKTRVRENNADPLYRNLGEAAGEYPAWNFHKYLVDRNGQLVASYSSFTGPGSGRLIKKIEALLEQQNM